MVLAYKYKLKASLNQISIMDNWLSMLRSLYNFCLRDRISAYEQVKAPVLANFTRLDNKGECCPLTCSVSYKC
jgi:putative transposase